MDKILQMIQEGKMDHIQLELTVDNEYQQAVERLEQNYLNCEQLIETNSAMFNQLLEAQNNVNELHEQQLIAAALRKGYEIAVGRKMAESDYKLFEERCDISQKRE